MSAIDLGAALEPVLRRIRYAAAFHLSTGALTAHEARWTQWLLGQGLPDEAGEDATLRLGVSTTPDFARVSWRCTHTAPHALATVAAYTHNSGIAAVNVDEMLAAHTRFQPAQVSTWLELWGDNADLGWRFDGEWPWAEVREWAGSSAEAAGLRGWVTSDFMRVTGRCTALAASVGEGYRFYALELALPSANPLALAGDALTAVGLEPLPDPALRLLARYPADHYSLSFWFADDGLVKAGVLVHDPALQLALALCQSAGLQEEGFERLAAFQATLDVPGPAAVEYQYLADQFSVELHYLEKPLTE